LSRKARKAAANSGPYPISFFLSFFLFVFGCPIFFCARVLLGFYWGSTGVLLEKKEKEEGNGVAIHTGGGDSQGELCFFFICFYFFSFFFLLIIIIFFSFSTVSFVSPSRV